MAKIYGAILIFLAGAACYGQALSGAPPLPMPSQMGKIDPQDFPKVCEESRDHFQKGPFPKSVTEAQLRSSKDLKPAPGKKWALNIAGFKILLPAGDYERRPLDIDHTRHEATAFLRSHNGLSLMIKLRPPEGPEGNASEKQFSDVFGKKMTFIEFFWEAYGRKTKSLNCKKFSDEDMKNLLAMTMKEADLSALTMNLTSLRVYKINEGSVQGILRVADGTKSDRSSAHRLVMEAQNGQGIITILATVSDERQMNAMAANLAGVGDEDMTGARPDWFAKLPTEIETGAKSGL